MALRPVVARRATRDGAVRHAGPAERACAARPVREGMPVRADRADSRFYVSCRAQAGRAGAGGAGRPGGGPGVVADGVCEEGGGEASVKTRMSPDSHVSQVGILIMSRLISYEIRYT